MAGYVAKFHVLEASMHYYKVLCLLRSLDFEIPPLRHCLEVSSSKNFTLTSFLCSSSIHLSILLNVIVPSIFTGSATDAHMSGIFKFRDPADYTAPVSSVHTATSRRTNLLPPSSRIAGSYIFTRRREAAAMELRIIIEGLDIWNDPSTPDWHAN